MLYVAHLVNEEKQSSTIKSYISAIRAVLYNGGIWLQEDQVLLTSITRACKLKNDKYNTKLPIRIDLMNVLVNSVDKIYESPQPYLVMLFKAMIITAYYGLFRVGEITDSPHVVKVVDVLLGENKDKLKFTLRSSKTHGEGDKPQIIKIKVVDISSKNKSDKVRQEEALKKEKCRGNVPFQLVTDYL